MRDIINYVEKQESHKRLDFKASYIPSEESKKLFFKTDLILDEEMKYLIDSMNGLFTGDRENVSVKYTDETRFHFPPDFSMFTPMTREFLYTPKSLNESMIFNTSRLTSTYNFEYLFHEGGKILLLDKPYMYDSSFIEYFDIIFIPFPKLGSIVIEKENSIFSKIKDVEKLGPKLATYQAFYENIMGDEEVFERATSISCMMSGVFQKNGFETAGIVDTPVFSLKVPVGSGRKLADNKVSCEVKPLSKTHEYLLFNLLSLSQKGATIQDAPTLCALIIAILDGRKSLDLTYFIDGYLNELEKREGTLY